MEEKGVWRTIRGRRVFIRDGEDLMSAMKRSGKFKNITDVKREEYQDLKAELKANKTDYLVRQDAKEQKLYTGVTSDLKGKHIYKYSTETQEQLDKASSLRDLNTGRIYDKTAIDQYKSRKDGYYYYIDTNVKNRDNPQFETYKEYVNKNLNNNEYLKANRPNEYFQKQLRESGVKTFADEIKEGNPIENMANKRIKEKNNTLNNDKIMLDYMKKKNIEEIQGMTQKDFENRISKNEKYLKTAGNITKAPEKISNPREAVDYHLKKGEFSKADKVMKDYGLEDEKDMFLEGQNYKVQADYKLYERKYNSLNEVIADRDSKLNRYINSKTPLEKMTRQQLAEYIVDDQISRGIVKEESRTMQVQGRLKGMGASKSMSKKELYLGAKDTQLSKMSLSELRKTAQEYNIDTTGLSKQKLIAKLIAIFK